MSHARVSERRYTLDFKRFQLSVRPTSPDSFY